MSAVLLALAAAAALGGATILQERAATAIPQGDGGPILLIKQLLRSRRWLLGKGIAALALGLQSLALARGTLMSVQAVLASNVAIALLLDRVVARASHRHDHMDPRAWLGIGLLAIGLPVALAAGNPSENPVGPKLFAWTIAVLVVSILGAQALLANRRGSLFGRTELVVELLAFGGGCLFALDAAYLTYTSHSIRDGHHAKAIFGAVGFLVFACFGNVLVQRAFQIGPLAVALPTVTAAEVIMAVVLGAFLLGEHLRPGIGPHAIAGVGAIAILAGAVVTARFSGRALDPDVSVAAESRV